MGLKFIIIVPHGFNDPSITLRHNDIRALGIAKKLESIIKELGHVPDFYVADTHRVTVDYNRKPSRDMPLRIAIREKIKQHHREGHYVVVFEMHSFPLGYDFYDFKDCPVALLSIPRYENDMKIIADYLNKNTDIKIISVPSTLTNDIQYDTSENIQKNIDHYLIEFHEDEKELKTSQIDNMLPILVEGVTNYIKCKQSKSVKIISICLVVLIVLLFIVFLCIGHSYFQDPLALHC